MNASLQVSRKSGQLPGNHSLKQIKVSKGEVGGMSHLFFPVTLSLAFEPVNCRIEVLVKVMIYLNRCRGQGFHAELRKPS